MYTYVTKTELKPYKTFCHKVLTELQQQLKTEGIIVSINLIGSGAENLVTQNDNGEFDLDYNLTLTAIPEKYLDNLHALKDKIRTGLDKIMSQKSPSEITFHTPPHGQDSTSVITYRYCLPVPCGSGAPTPKYFCIDIALMVKGVQKLIHDKPAEAFIWNQVPDFSKQTKKMKSIKSLGKWGDVRNLYLQKKNDHTLEALPSYAIYSLTLNEVFQKIQQKKQGGRLCQKHQAIPIQHHK